MSFTEIAPTFSLPDEVWEQVKSAIPPQPAKPKGGRPRMPDRTALDAIFYLMRTGCQWRALPCALGASSTVHDRYQEWVEQGVFQRCGNWNCKPIAKWLELTENGWRWMGQWSKPHWGEKKQVLIFQRIDIAKLFISPIFRTLVSVAKIGSKLKPLELRDSEEFLVN